LSLWQISEADYLRGGKIYFGTWVQKFQSMSACSHHSGPKTGPNIIGGGVTECGCLPHGSQEAKKSNRKEPGPRCTIQRHSPSDPFPLTCPPPTVAPPLHSLLRFWIHQWIKVSIGSDTSWSKISGNKQHHRYTQRSTLLSPRSLHPIKLIIKTNHYTGWGCRSIDRTFALHAQSPRLNPQHCQKKKKTFNHHR
jgi:hypothetical protein